MQTFLPYRDFRKCADVLDRKRLGKQRVEAVQILRGNLGLTEGWRNHPAARMWRGYEGSLLLYLIHINEEWKERGYQSPKIDEHIHWISHHNTLKQRIFFTSEPPPWLGSRRLHVSHQSNLLRKDPEHYSQFGWKCGPDLPYYWPEG